MDSSPDLRGLLVSEGGIVPVSDIRDVVGKEIVEDTGATTTEGNCVEVSKETCAETSEGTCSEATDDFGSKDLNESENEMESILDKRWGPVLMIEEPESGT